MSCGIEVGSCMDVHQWIVVSPDHKGHVHKVLLEMFSNAPLESEKLKLGTVVGFLHWCKGAAAKSDGMLAPIILFLRQHSIQPFLGGISLQEEWFVKIREHQHWGRLNLVLQDPYSLSCLRGNCTGPILTSFPNMS